MTSNVETAVSNILASLRKIGKLEFRVRNTISSVVLSSNEEFEAHCIRDADEAELSLFQPASESNTIHRGDGDGTSWASGPAIVRAQPIVDSLPEIKNLSKAHANPGDITVTRSYLIAIKKLLDVYPQPRLAEHVEALSRQLDTLQGSISDMQSTLNSMSNQSQPRKRPPSTINNKIFLKVQKTQHDNQQALDEIEDLIQHEQLEILALTDLRDEKRAELRKIREKKMQAESKTSSTAVPSPQKLRARKTPSKPKSMLSEVNDPFFYSRTESLRRSIRRIQSPRVRSELPSSGLRPTITIDQGDDDHVQNTPTPKTITQKKIEKNLTQLRLRANMQSGGNLQDQLSKTLESTSRTRNDPSPSPDPSLPQSIPIDQPEPSISSTGAAVVIEAQQPLPESRLNTVHRLNSAFWKSASMVEPLLELCHTLKEQFQNEDSQVTYQDTIAGLNRLLESYRTTPTLTASQLIEAVLYKELLKALSSPSPPPIGTTNAEQTGFLEVLLHEEEWCLPLEAVKSLLVKACESFGVDSSLNRTVVYFLVGKGVIRIERRASPIAICIC
ncbi:hypothetical protein MJO28_004229 [Puccinia striiformis f. sp. tritici]|uniref:Uncharacterized protein n=1 Tax=Puccinia striiformis f. sp. tritici TaxID=168172 RepID=A0ACC0EQN1_9BASI|nr:hypothetical protein Pst134EB_008306 [Puccinia striiformis f. sp. tritici]KAI7957134.1 hypothetical protein MJO28_004229 [Puccinia striiformis f. sp. tritici]KAI7963634.1 hypothetical protein MJO29_004061 [Puccinia striiformis f. sp. tritici]